MPDPDGHYRVRLGGIPDGRPPDGAADTTPPDQIARDLRSLLADTPAPGPAEPQDDRDRRQQAALARAVSSGDAEQVLQAARDAVREWNQPGVLWPDNWRLWQQALDDALPPGQHVDLHDLAGAPRPAFDREAASPDMRAAWDLGHMPAETIPAVVARLNVRDAAEIRDLLGAQSPGHGIDFGPNAGLAYQACARRLDAGHGPADATVPAAQDTTSRRPAAGTAEADAGTQDPRTALLELTLGGYRDAPELAAARDAIDQAWNAVAAAVPAEPGPEAAGFGAPLPALGTAVTAALAAADPDTARTRYTDVREQAARLADAATAPAGHLLSVAAYRLSGAAEAHLARLHATGPAAAGLLAAAAAIPAGDATPDTDPLGLRPRPYQDRAAVTAARAAIARLREEWRRQLPARAEHDAGSAAGRLASHLAWAAGDLGVHRESWGNTISAALAALAEPPGRPEADQLLPGLIRAVHTHREHLAAYATSARQAAEPYDSVTAYLAGRGAASDAWRAWRRAPTWTWVRNLTDREVRGTDLYDVKHAGQNLIAGFYALSAFDADQDPGLDRAARHADTAADACYALKLTLRRSDFRDPADTQALETLIEAAYLHAARIRAARDTGLAGQVAAGIAAQAAAARPAEPAPDAASEAPAPSAREAAAAAAGPDTPPGLVIEHGHGGTVVRGTDRADKAVQDLLRRGGFKWSGRQQFWYLPRPWSPDRRASRVQALKSGLERLGRAFSERDNAAAWQDSQDTQAPPPVPPGEPYPSMKQAHDAARGVLLAYGQLLDTPAGARMLTYARETRPDAAALKAAVTGLRDANRPDSTPGSLTEALTACYHAAQALHDHLTAEGHRAPKFASLLDTPDQPRPGRRRADGRNRRSERTQTRHAARAIRIASFRNERALRRPGPGTRLTLRRQRPRPTRRRPGQASPGRRMLTSRRVQPRQLMPPAGPGRLAAGRRRGNAASRIPTAGDQPYASSGRGARRLRAGPQRTSSDAGHRSRARDVRARTGRAGPGRCGCPRHRLECPAAQRRARRPGDRI